MSVRVKLIPKWCKLSYFLSSLVRYKTSVAAPSVRRNKPTLNTKELTRHTNAKPYHQVPGAKILPLFGTMWQVVPPFNQDFDIKRPYDLILKQYQEYGPIWRDVVPTKGEMVNIASVEDIERTLHLDGKFPQRTCFEAFKKYREDRLDQFSTAGIFSTNGEEWWRVRSKAQPMLEPQNTLLYLPSMTQVAEQMITRIRVIRNKRNQVPDNFLTEMCKWALESVSLVALDARLGCLDENLPANSEPCQMIQALQDVVDATYKLEMSFQLYQAFPVTKDWRKMVKAQDYFTKTSLKYIQQAMKRSKAKVASDSNELTMLEAMLAKGMEVKEAVTMTIDMLMAGIDTTSNTTGFLLYFLARNPEKQERLRQDIDRVLPSKTTPIEPVHLDELRYLKACVQESLRLAPATIGIGRTLSEDAILSGYRIPKGTIVMCHLQMMSRLEKYFPKPDAYIPERWVKDHVLESHASPYTILPFGYGPRGCIGRLLAEQEIYLLVIKILQNFRIEFHNPDLGMELRLVNTPDQPLRFTFVDR